MDLNINRYKADMVLFTVFIAVSLYTIFNAYIFDVKISPDSTYYLGAAQSLLDGNGFYILSKAGNTSVYFATWPIGYPFLIAVVAFITKTTNLYFASKILSIGLIGLILIMFRIRFGIKAVFISLLLLTPAFLSIFSYTWSEQVFIFASIWFSFALYDVISVKNPKWYHYLLLMISSLAIFFSRYVGPIQYV